MGFLRFLLALSVAYGHAGNFFGFPLIPGDTAVQTFFVISGFYMTLVLNEKYLAGSSSYSVFISARFARLFPAYLTVLAMTLAAAFIALRYGVDLPFVSAWRAIESSDLVTKAFLAVTQFVIWGQDLYAFLIIENGALNWRPSIPNTPMPVFSLSVIPQAWTLGIEISFYVIAPFLVRRSALTISAVLFASIVLRLALQIVCGFHDDPWSYRFFPSELALFLAGALGYHVYRAMVAKQGIAKPMLLFGAAVLCVGAALLVNRWNGMSRVASVAFLVMASLAIPFLFFKTRNMLFDRHIGELSYPIYICHILVIWVVGALMAGVYPVVIGLAAMAGTLILSIALYVFVDLPVDRWRQRRFERARRQLTPQNAAAQSG